MDEESGSNVADQSGNGNDGTATGTTIVNGKIGKARDFESTYPDYVNIPHSAVFNVSSITVAAWINTESLGLYQQIISKDFGATDRQWQFRMHIDNKLEFLVFKDNVTSQSQKSLSTISISTWTHVVGTWDGTTVKTYLNGVSDGTPSSFSGTLNSGTKNLRIGHNIDPADTFFWDGLIDEVRLYDRALSTDDIAELYAYRPPNPPTLYLIQPAMRW